MRLSKLGNKVSSGIRHKQNSILDSSCSGSCKWSANSTNHGRRPKRGTSGRIVHRRPEADIDCRRKDFWWLLIWIPCFSTVFCIFFRMISALIYSHPPLCEQTHWGWHTPEPSVSCRCCSLQTLWPTPPRRLGTWQTHGTMWNRSTRLSKRNTCGSMNLPVTGRPKRFWQMLSQITTKKGFTLP